MNKDKLAEALAQLLYDRTFLTEGDSEDLAWDVLSFFEEEGVTIV